MLYRQVNLTYQRHFDHFIRSGLYEQLVSSALLIPHEETDHEADTPSTAYKVLRPEPIHFVSYPYEWCFGQLRAAALAILRIQAMALEAGMTLKDASAFNIQFKKGEPILIDTLSFEQYSEGEPWAPYAQFCRHFLAPLVLTAYRDARLSQLLRIHVDGIPLDLASALLPWRTFFKFPVLTHIHLHARSQMHFGRKPPSRVSRPSWPSSSTGTNLPDTPAVRKPRIARRSLAGFLAHLESAVRGLEWTPPPTPWSDYYENTNYSDQAFQRKAAIVGEWLDRIRPRDVWDLGANTGVFSRAASARAIPTLSFDGDPAAVELNYRDCRRRRDPCILPLWIDLTNPSPALGWQHRERMSLAERGPADLVLALALVHHLAIANNTPWERVAQFLASLGRILIVEFVPKNDSQVQRLLATRQDIFDEYTAEGFRKHFSEYFSLLDLRTLPDSARTLYLMERRRPSS